MWINIKNDQKLSLTIGIIAVLVGTAGLVFSLGMSSLLSTSLIAGGASLITRSLCNAVPKHQCRENTAEETGRSVSSNTHLVFDASLD
jgi:hypothetical protein